MNAFIRSLVVCRFALVFASAFMLAGVAQAEDREQVPAETRITPFSADIPACDSPWTVEKITSRFAWAERKYWNSDLAIARIEHIKTTAFRPRGLDLIPRRFCTARVVLSNQDKRPMAYVIIENAGIIGAAHDVHWCVSGYDRNWSYPPACDLIRP